MQCCGSASLWCRSGSYLSLCCRPGSGWRLPNKKAQTLINAQIGSHSIHFGLSSVNWTSIRIQLITLKRIRILPFNLMRIHTDPDLQDWYNVPVAEPSLRPRWAPWCWCFTSSAFASALFANHIFWALINMKIWKESYFIHQKMATYGYLSVNLNDVCGVWHVLNTYFHRKTIKACTGTLLYLT